MLTSSLVFSFLSHPPNLLRIESRSTQQINLKVSPITTCYSPTGRHLLYTSHGNSIYFMAYDRGESAAAGSPEQWRLTENDAVSTTFPFSDPFLALFPAVSLSHSSPYSNLTIGYQYKYNTDAKQQLPGSAAIFNNTGDGIILTHTSEHTVRVLDFPSLSVRETPPAHVAGAVCTAIDPRGRCVYALNSTGNKLAEFLFPSLFLLFAKSTQISSFRRPRFDRQPV